MDLLLKRALCSVVFFTVGINLIGYGMISNGYDSPRNPAWQFFAGLFEFEKTVFLVLTGVAGVCVLAWLLFLAAEAAGKSRAHENGGNPAARYSEPPRSLAYETAEDAYQPTPVYVPRSEPVETTRAPLPKPEPPELTPEEVKEKAIQEILRRW